MNEFRIKKTGELIFFYDATLSSSKDSFVWTFNALVSDLVALEKLKPRKNLGADYVEVSFKLGLETFELVIENADSRDTDNSFSVSGRSRSILLAEPYAKEMTKTWPATTAHTIVQELCDLAGIVLVWEVIDWAIDTYIAEKRYPIDIISDLIGENNLGAIIQSLPNGSLTIVYHPICSPNKLAAQIPNFKIATDTNLFTRATQFINNTNFNSVLITTETAAAAATVNVAFEETIDGKDRLIKIITTPFVPETDINLHHTSGENIAVFYEGVFSESVTDQLIVQDGKAQLSKPFDTLTAATWHQNVIGTLAIDNYGAITTEQGFGLVTIGYTSKHHRYRINNRTGIDLTALAVDEIAAPLDLNALTLEFAMGAGDRPAPPIVVKTLSTLPALVKRAEAELWQQLYDQDDYTINCAYQNHPMLVGKIAEVTIRKKNEVFNGYLSSVDIKLDDTITQTVIIERPIL